MMLKDSYRTIRFCLLLVLLIGVLYVNSLPNEFTNWDDQQLIGRNEKIRSLSPTNILAMFTPETATTYQPVRVLSYAMDYHFWKLNPMGYRITNILFYILTCLLVFFTIQTLSAHFRPDAGARSHEWAAFLGGLLFAVHPVHVEAVTWLAARKEVLMGFFFFLAFYLYLRSKEEAGRKAGLYLAGVLISFLLAILSKPSAVVFPGVILVYEIAMRKGTWLQFLKDHRAFFLLSILLSALFTGILIKVMIEAGGIKPHYGDSLVKNLLVSFTAFWRFNRLLLFTTDYAAAYSFTMSLPLFSIKHVATVGGVFLLLGTAFFSLKWTRVFFFAVFFFVVTLLPFLNLIPISTLLADRYLFLASFSLAFLGGTLFERIYSLTHPRFSPLFFKLMTVLLFTTLLAGYSFMTLHQNTVWRDSYTLWSDAVEKSPGSNTANAMMGAVYAESKMDKEARMFLERAVQILPKDYHSRNNLGIVYGRLGMIEEAAIQFETAMRIMPGDPTFLINMAAVYLGAKEYQKAETILKRMVEVQPGNTNLNFRLFLVYKGKGDTLSAISTLEKVIRSTPAASTLYMEMADLYLTGFGNTEKARAWLIKGIEITSKGNPRGDEIRWMIQDLDAGG